MKSTLLGIAALGFAVSTAVAQTTAGSSTTLIVPVVAQTGSYSSEVTLFNPNAAAISVLVSYYDANNLPTGGPKTCTPVDIPAHRSVPFDLASRCTLEPGGHFGLLVASEATLTQEFFGYARTQNPQGIGFSTEGFPVESFSDAVSHVTGLKRTAGGGGLPPFQTNCFVTSLGQAVSYELKLFDDTTGAQIGSTVTAYRLPYTQYRFLDVFGPAGVNAPAGDYANVRAQFRNLTGDGTALIGFCTVQDNLTFAADFRIAKSLSDEVYLQIAKSMPAEVFVNDSLVTAVVDSVSQAASFSSIAVGTDGLPVIGYYDAAVPALKVAKCANAMCTMSTKTTVDDTSDVGQYPSLAIGADGLPVVSYYDATHGTLKVLKCGNAACSAANTITAVDTTGNVGRYTSMTIGGDGKPVVSYYDVTNADLKLAKCGNAACNGGNTITVVDSAGDVGAYSSIARGADGLPVISYHAATTRALKVAKCSDPACVARTVITVESGQNSDYIYGEHSSIALGADGLPVISHIARWMDFIGLQGADVEVIKCNSAECFGGTHHVIASGCCSRWATIARGADGLPVIAYDDPKNWTLTATKCGDPACGSGNSKDEFLGSPFGPVSIAIGADGLPIISYVGYGGLLVVKCGRNMNCAPD